MKSVLKKINDEFKNNGDFKLKIRLRGKGSGYYEINHKYESDDELQLNLSCFNPKVMNAAKYEIESLLNKVYKDYYDYLRKYREKATLMIPECFNFKIPIK